MIQPRTSAKIFGPTPSLRCHLELGAGHGLTLLGANGTARTTLLRILHPVRPPGARCASRHRRGQAPDTRAGSSTWSATLLGVRGLTALENFGSLDGHGGHDAASPVSAPRGIGRARHGGRSPTRTFSAGMKRRLALARVLLGRARLLLLDGLHRPRPRGPEVAERVPDVVQARGELVLATHSFDRSIGVPTAWHFSRAGVSLRRPAGGLASTICGPLRRPRHGARRRAHERLHATGVDRV